MTDDIVREQSKGYDDILSFIKDIKEKEISCWDINTMRYMIVRKILGHLGWNVYNPDEAEPGYNRNPKEFDFMLKYGEFQAFINIIGIEEFDKCCQEYWDCYFSGCGGITVLTNGIMWQFKLPNGPAVHTLDRIKQTYRIYKIDILKEESKYIAKFLNDFLAKNTIKKYYIDNSEEKRGCAMPTESICELIGKKRWECKCGYTSGIEGDLKYVSEEIANGHLPIRCHGCGQLTLYVCPASWTKNEDLSLEFRLGDNMEVKEIYDGLYEYSVTGKDRLNFVWMPLRTKIFIQLSLNDQLVDAEIIEFSIYSHRGITKVDIIKKIEKNKYYLINNFANFRDFFENFKIKIVANKYADKLQIKIIDYFY